MGPAKPFRGVTLVELTIAQLLGLLVIGAVLRLMPAGMILQGGANAVYLLQESERMVVDVIGHHIAQAGYAGCHGGGSHATAITTAAVSQRLANWAYGRFRLFGRDGGDSAGIEQIMGPGWSRARHRHDGQLIGDLLWTQSARGPGMSVISHDPAAATLVLAATDPPDLAAGAVLRISDCRHSATFQISTERPPAFDGASGRLVVEYGALSTLNCSASSAPSRVFLGGRHSPDCESGDFAPYRFPVGSTVMALDSSLLYIGRHQQTGEPALYRLGPAANGARLSSESLVEGVENMRIRYGMDSDEDGAPDGWLSASDIESAGADWDGVVAVRLWVMLRTTALRGESRFRSAQAFPDRDGNWIVCEGDNIPADVCPFDISDGTGSGYRRRVVEKTIALRNRTVR